MIPQSTVTKVVSNGTQAEGAFGISHQNVAHIMRILRDQLYSDKILAVLREYSSNAWDEHLECGKRTQPIHVTLPTYDEPTLIIRDFGRGLSEVDIFQIFTQYGESTKRGLPSSTGWMGIGAKSGFCYSESFTVTSFHAGKKTIYFAHLDETDEGRMKKMHVESTEETGLEIRIAAKISDISQFREKAEYLYRWYNPRPVINIELPKEEVIDTPHGIVTRGAGYYSPLNWVAIMGCNPYRLDLAQLRNELVEDGYWEVLHRLSGCLFFDMGEVHTAASREELKYTDSTKATIREKINRLIDAYIEKALEKLGRDDVSNWDKRMEVYFIDSTLQLPVPKIYHAYAERTVTLYEDDKTKPKTFTVLVPDGGITNQLIVSPDTKVYLRDDTRPLRGYHLGRTSGIVLNPVGQFSEAIAEEFEQIAKNAQIDGIPIGLLSAEDWDPPITVTPKSRTPNEKHKVRTFQLQFDKTGRGWSSAWAVVNRVPLDSDVFMIIQNFKVIDWESFHDTYRRDVRFAKELGVQMPPVYGYKTTPKKQITDKDCKGTPYRVWRLDFFKKHIGKDVIEALETKVWNDFFPYSYSRKEIREACHLIRAKLGVSHPASKFFLRLITADYIYTKKTRSKQGLVRRAEEFIKPTEDPRARLQALQVRYPMLQFLNESRLEYLDPTNLGLWLDYFALVDSKDKS